MRILMVTPHVPPHQAANALLPHLLGQGLRARGHEVRVLTLGDGADTETIRFVRRRLGALRVTRLPQALEALATWRQGAPLVRWADVVHVHSNTWMNQIAARLACRAGRPYVLTHYGTEIWHYDGRNATFRRLNARAHHVTFYSQALLERGRELGLALPAASVVYPPVADTFRPPTPAERLATRRELGVDGGPLLVNVKRLHPTADQITLLRAFALVAHASPNAALLIAGTGETQAQLEAEIVRLSLAGRARLLGLLPNERIARLAGAADLFVLSSVLEATPTVALEALASGTPVVSTDNPGGTELGTFFGDDVILVPRQDPEALARAIVAQLAAPRRVRPETLRLVDERFRLAGVVESYLRLYEKACAS
jgi:glycosyltransferase involved in cell wall biosynthesis